MESRHGHAMNDTVENTAHDRHFYYVPKEQRNLGFSWFYLMDTGSLKTDCAHLFTLNANKEVFILQNQYDTINNVISYISFVMFWMYIKYVHNIYKDEIILYMFCILMCQYTKIHTILSVHFIVLHNISGSSFNFSPEDRYLYCF